MRHDAWRRDAASYPLRGEMLPRYTDVAVWQHLNNTALITIQGESVQQGLRSVLGPDAWRDSMPVLGCVSHATDFLAEAYYPGPLAWGAKVLGVDAGGLRIAAALFQKDQCVGLHEATISGWADGAVVGLGAEQMAALRTAQVPGADAMAPAGAAARQGAATSAGHGHGHAPTLEHFPWRRTEAIRFGDSDARRLASDNWLARCAEQMRVEFMNHLYGPQRRVRGGMMVAHVGLRWLRRAAPGTEWQLGCGVAHVGERSVAVRGAMFEAGRCLAVCDSVMVAIDHGSRRSAQITDEARAAMEPYRLRAEQAPPTA